MGGKTFLCFGEILWDCLPRGLFLGGAPLNVGFHINQFNGFTGFIVSSIGDDFLGKEVIRRMNSFTLPTKGIHTNKDKPTGAVLVELNSAGSAGYEFLADCAWDSIHTQKEHLPHPQHVSGIIFGTLAFRSDQNYHYFHKLIEYYEGAPLYFDINFREPFVNYQLTDELCKKADLIKLNHEELAMVLNRELSENPDLIGEWAAEFSKKCGDKDVVVTAGDLGAGVYEKKISKWHFEKSQSIKVVDTVGAGDSFLASFIVNKEIGASYEDCLKKACRMGEYVATKDGATPIHPEFVST